MGRDRSPVAHQTSDQNCLTLHCRLQYTGNAAMPYFAFFSLFLNALLNDTFHPLLVILALLFCITPLARLSPCFHSPEKTSVSEGSTWYVRIVSN